MQFFKICSLFDLTQMSTHQSWCGSLLYSSGMVFTKRTIHTKDTSCILKKSIIHTEDTSCILQKNQSTQNIQVALHQKVQSTQKIQAVFYKKYNPQTRHSSAPLVWLWWWKGEAMQFNDGTVTSTFVSFVFAKRSLRLTLGIYKHRILLHSFYDSCERWAVFTNTKFFCRAWIWALWALGWS